MLVKDLMMMPNCAHFRFSDLLNPSLLSRLYYTILTYCLFVLLAEHLAKHYITLVLPNFLFPFPSSHSIYSFSSVTCRLFTSIVSMYCNFCIGTSWSEFPHPLYTPNIIKVLRVGICAVCLAKLSKSGFTAAHIYRCPILQKRKGRRNAVFHRQHRTRR